MIQALLRWVFKMFAQMVFWVFVLSISWKHETLFERAHTIFVDNEFVDYADRKLDEIWMQVSEWGKYSIRSRDEEDDKSL